MTETRLDRMEKMVEDMIIEGRRDSLEAKKVRAAMEKRQDRVDKQIEALTKATTELINLRIQDHRDAVNPVPSPNHRG